MTIGWVLDGCGWLLDGCWMVSRMVSGRFFGWLWSTTDDEHDDDDDDNDASGDDDDKGDDNGDDDGDGIGPATPPSPMLAQPDPLVRSGDLASRSGLQNHLACHDGAI